MLAPKFGLAWLVPLAMGTAADFSASSFSHQSANRDAFSQAAPALDAAELRIFNFGNRLFNTNWVIAPASASGFDGLGPTFNRVSCSGCHLRDGRGRPPINAESELLSMVLRISIPGVDAHGGPKSVPGYGTQINDRAIPGVAPEAQPRIQWQEMPGAYADGTPFSLRKPLILIDKLAYGALPSKVLTSLRVAPAVFGMGLIDGLSDAAILARSDPNDADQDGISGRVNRVYSNLSPARAVGRYGWKASVATLSEQNLGAALNDIGITSDIHPKQNCPPRQSACTKAENGGEAELSEAFAAKLNQYVHTLGVPAARAQSPQSRRGAALFRQFQCVGCHLESLRTDAHSPHAYLRHQSFSAYTDVLLHDLGPGLADGRPDFQASGVEWRTAPLWGVGLVPAVNDHNFYLHDGRARGLAEAILWHGGEAVKAKERFRNAAKTEREALLAFLQTL
jgi:CxxC motif-containing protein (DUF1111 family)